MKERIETDRQAEAFEYYYSLKRNGEEKPQERTAKEYGVSVRSVKNWSTWFDWPGRVVERNKEISEQVAEEVVKREVKEQLSYLDTTNRLVDKLRVMVEGASTKVETVKDVDTLVGSIERLMRLGIDIQGGTSNTNENTENTKVKPHNIIWDVNGGPDEELDKQEVPIYDDAGNIYLNRLIPKQYNEMVDEILFGGSSKKHKEFVAKGGRHSVKSTVAAIVTVLVPWLNIGDSTCTRRYKSVLRDSCFASCVDAIEKMGLQDDFEWSDADNGALKIKCTKTDMIIYFFGLDEPKKIRSFKPRNGVKFVWLEECQMLENSSKPRDLKQTMMRKGKNGSKNEKCVFLYCFNPLPIKTNWCNTELVTPLESKYIIHVNYTDIPQWWISEEFLQEAEEVKALYPEIYRNEYLGEVIGAAGLVFKNIKELVKDITFSRTYLFRGLDIGYENDPTAYVVWAYDAQKREIYCLSEAGGEPMYADVIYPYIKEENKHNATVIVDSQALETIRILSQKGLNVEPSSKPKESVKLGLSWLQRLKGIYIDPLKCPNTYKEFTEYKYKVDKNGESNSEFSDKNNHFIDATRYALQKYILHK